jgi:DNA-binding FadR family transcriptional regulator
VELRRVLEEYVVGVAARQTTDEGISALRRCLGQLYVTCDLDAEWTAANSRTLTTTPTHPRSKKHVSASDTRASFAMEAFNRVHRHATSEER